jgi:hypothetical protein
MVSNYLRKNPSRSFEDLYPNIADWVNGYGWIEIGCDDCRTSFVRVLDIGGMIWESGEKGDKTTSQALAEAEKAIKRWRAKNER